MDFRHILLGLKGKAESKPKHEEKNLFGRFSSKTKNFLFQGSKIVVFKTQILNLYFCVCSLNKGVLFGCFLSEAVGQS